MYFSRDNTIYAFVVINEYFYCLVQSSGTTIMTVGGSVNSIVPTTGLEEWEEEKKRLVSVGFERTQMISHALPQPIAKILYDPERDKIFYNGDWITPTDTPVHTNEPKLYESMIAAGACGVYLTNTGMEFIK